MKNIGPIGDKHLQQLQLVLDDGTVLVPPQYIEKPLLCPCGCGAMTTWQEEIAGTLRALTDLVANEVYRGNPVTRSGMARIVLTLMAARNVVPATFHAPGAHTPKPH